MLCGTWSAFTAAGGNSGKFTVLYPTAMCLLWIFFSFLYVFRREWRLPFDKDIALRVAVVVPAQNEELVIARTLESLLAQDYPHREIHVVSDGSTDATGRDRPPLRRSRGHRTRAAAEPRQKQRAPVRAGSDSNRALHGG